MWHQWPTCTEQSKNQRTLNRAVQEQCFGRAHFISDNCQFFSIYFTIFFKGTDCALTWNHAQKKDCFIRTTAIQTTCGFLFGRWVTQVVNKARYGCRHSASPGTTSLVLGRWEEQTQWWVCSASYTSALRRGREGPEYTCSEYYKR